MKLPQINELVEQVKERVRSVEKVAAVVEPEKTPEFVSDLASGLHKVAAYLRSQDFTAITYDDIRAFSNKMLGKS